MRRPQASEQTGRTCLCRFQAWRAVAAAGGLGLRGAAAHPGAVVASCTSNACGKKHMASNSFLVGTARREPHGRRDLHGQSRIAAGVVNHGSLSARESGKVIDVLQNNRISQGNRPAGAVPGSAPDAGRKDVFSEIVLHEIRGAFVRQMRNSLCLFVEWYMVDGIRHKL